MKTKKLKRNGVKHGKHTARGRGDWQGMNWIRQSKRLAIYLRDGCACAYCGTGIEDGAILTLDHLKPHAKGGDNHESNLVTCCKSCNDKRGARELTGWIADVSVYCDTTVDAICDRIERADLDLTEYHEEAKRLMARRGSCADVLASRKPN